MNYITRCACSRRHVVEVFSSGWHKPIFMQRELSPVLSMELLLDPDDYEQYSFTWMELERRPPVVEGIGEFSLLVKLLFDKYRVDTPSSWARLLDKKK